ncbi:MAG: DUF302 domain-containing protein [Bacteroidetes bacterium]|nr:DUF302 domain-containing protein [Bacteroidota bacterium]
MQYSISKTTSYSFEQAIEKVTEELKKEGFGVLTTIDMKETLHKKLGVEIGRYTILGACNPQFANNALNAELEVGLFLPCNVIVYEQNGGVTVSAFDPAVIESVVKNETLHSLSRDVRQRLQNVITAL